MENASAARQQAITKLGSDRLQLTAAQALEQQKIANGVDATLKSLQSELTLRTAIEKLQKDQSAPVRQSDADVLSRAAALNAPSGSHPSAPNVISIPGRPAVLPVASPVPYPTYAPAPGFQQAAAGAEGRGPLTVIASVNSQEVGRAMADEIYDGLCLSVGLIPGGAAA